MIDTGSVVQQYFGIAELCAVEKVPEAVCRGRGVGRGLLDVDELLAHVVGVPPLLRFGVDLAEHRHEIEFVEIRRPAGKPMFGEGDPADLLSVISIALIGTAIANLLMGGFILLATSGYSGSVNLRLQARSAAMTP